MDRNAARGSSSNQNHRRLARSSSSNAVEALLTNREKLSSSNLKTRRASGLGPKPNRNEPALLSNRDKNSNLITPPISYRANSKKGLELEAGMKDVERRSDKLISIENRLDKNKEIMNSRKERPTRTVSLTSDSSRKKERRASTVSLTSESPRNNDETAEAVNLKLKHERLPIVLNSWTPEKEDERNVIDEFSKRQGGGKIDYNKLPGNHGNVRDRLGLVRSSTYPLGRMGITRQDVSGDDPTSSESTVVPKLNLEELNAEDELQKPPAKTVSRGWSLLRKKLIEVKEDPTKNEESNTEDSATTTTEDSTKPEDQSTVSYFKMLRERLRRCKPAEIVASSNVDEIVRLKQDLVRRQSLSSAPGKKNSFFEAVLTAHALSKQGKLSNRSTPSSRRTSRSEPPNFLPSQLPGASAYKTKFQCSPHFQKTINLMGKNDLFIKEEDMSDAGESANTFESRYSV